MKVLVLFSVGLALAWADGQNEDQLDPQGLRKRDGAHHHPPPPVPQESSYAAPPSSYAAPPSSGYASHGDSNMYYYYYPMEEHPAEPAPMEEDKKKKKGGDEEKKCLIEKLLPPIILIVIWLGIIAGSLVGVVPILSFEAALAFLLPNNGREGADGELNEITTVVARALEMDECMTRLLCEGGKYAEGYTTTLSILDFLTPKTMVSKMKIFKDSARKKTNCKQYTCSYVDWKSTSR